MVKEETGFDVKIKRLLVLQDKKYSFECEIAGGSLLLDKNVEDNTDIIEVRWVHLRDESKFDAYTKPVIELLKKRLE